MYCLHDANYILISNVFLNLIILKKSEMVFLNLLMTSLRDPDFSVSWTLTCGTIKIQCDKPHYIPFRKEASRTKHCAID